MRSFPHRLWSAYTQWDQGCSQGVFLTEALAEFQHVNCMIVQICEVKGVACYARAETFTEAVVSVASMVVTPLGNENRMSHESHLYRL